MTAHFIDVGQAEAVLLEFSCGAMLVDAGSDEEHNGALVGYLNAFFQRRADLHRTLDLVLITHNHIDHTRSLRGVIENFTVKRYFDNGFVQGSGVANPNWLKKEVADGHRTMVVREIAESAVVAATGHAGLTDADIAPFHCATVSPRIHILAGHVEPNPGWTEDDFTNQNNHSLVTKVDFGQASFLFMGDLQEAAIESLLTLYGNGFTGELNTDVLQVGHHGSHNATTVELLKAVTPNLAVVTMGPWTFGQASSSAFTTYAYGHPREDIIKLLSNNLSRKRAQPRKVMVARKAREFHEYTVTKAIYGTGWDGTIKVIASAQGTFRVFREH